MFWELIINHNFIFRVFNDLRNKALQPPETPAIIPLEAPTPAEENPPEKSTSTNATEDSIVIDDEKQTESTSTAPPVAPVVLEVPKTNLEHLLQWLHGQVPLTTEQLQKIVVEMGDFDTALKKVQPSAKREGFATVPDVTWDDVGSLQNIREELQMTILVSLVYHIIFWFKC